MKPDFPLWRLSSPNYSLKFYYSATLWQVNKRQGGGDNNIHSWDIGLKGKITKEQNILLNKLFKERRESSGLLNTGLNGWMGCLLHCRK